MNRLFLLFFAAIFMTFNTYTVSAANEVTVSMPHIVKVALLSRTLHNQSYQDPTYNIETDYVLGLTEKLGVEAQFVVYPNVSAIHNALDSGEVDIAVGLSEANNKNYLFSAPLYRSSIAIWYQNKSLTHKSPRTMKWACVKGSIYCEKLLLLQPSRY